METQDLRIEEGPTLVREHAARKLRDAIAAGLYKPGARLVERELCEALGVSRTSVREAMRQLQAENLIRVGPRRNISVAVLTVQDAHDIYELRELVEPIALRRFIAEADAAALQQVSDSWAMMRKIFAKREFLGLAREATRLYEHFLTHCGSPVYRDTGMQLLNRVSYLRLTAMSTPGRLESGMEEWRLIVEATLRRDADAAEAAFINHIRNARHAIEHKLTSANSSI
jgi:DNA-binding GntR family transcriptional regulator